MNRQRHVRAISDELMSLRGTGRQVAPFSRRYENFSLGEAYEIAAEVRRLREARGEIPVGRKIGFTNQSAWSGIGISAPIWNYVYDRTVENSSSRMSEFRLLELPEPRIEPELVLHLGAE